MMAVVDADRTRYIFSPTLPEQVQAIARKQGPAEEVRDYREASGRMCLVARPEAVMLDRVVQRYARVTASIGTDQLWAALRQWGATTLTGREGL